MLPNGRHSAPRHDVKARTNNPDDLGTRRGRPACGSRCSTYATIGAYSYSRQRRDAQRR